MNNTYRELTKTITQTSYEITCGVCGHIWKSSTAYGECSLCIKRKAEQAFQDKHKHLIGARVTAVVSDGDASRPDVKHIVICDDSGDYWKVIGERDYEYGAYIGIEEYEGDEKRE